LQGFPDGWTATSNGETQSDRDRYAQLGNSVAVPVFEWVARRIDAIHHTTAGAGVTA
jgi:DNA (cytosine-5)-methyltransferase 1